LVKNVIRRLVDQRWPIRVLRPGTAVRERGAPRATIRGIDRVRIVKRVAATCFLVDLESPPSGGNGGLTLPANWGFASARTVQPADACLGGTIARSYDATSQSGTIRWPARGPQPTIDEISATLVFASPPAWCPASETLSATNVPVQ